MVNSFATFLFPLTLAANCDGVVTILDFASGPPPYAYTAFAPPVHKPSSSASDMFTLVQSQLQSQMHIMKQRQEEEVVKATQLQNEQQRIANQEHQQSVQIDKIGHDVEKLFYLKRENAVERQRLLKLAQESNKELKLLHSDHENAMAESKRLTKTEHEIQELQGRVSEATTKKSILERSISQMRDEKRNSEINTATKYKNSQEMYRGIKGKFEPLQSTYLKLLHENHQIATRRAALEHNMESLKTQQLDMASKLHDMKAAIAADAASKKFGKNSTQLENKLKQLQAELLHDTKIKASLLNWKHKAETVVEKSTKDTLMLQQEIEDLTSQLRHLMPVLTKLSDTNANLEKNISDMEAHIS